jgi:hypothetical protein
MQSTYVKGIIGQRQHLIKNYRVLQLAQALHYLIREEKKDQQIPFCITDSAWSRGVLSVC